MNTFDFDDRQVMICGDVYMLNFNHEDFGEKAEAVDAALKNEKNERNISKKTKDAFRNLIDLLLGEGAFDRIFASQPVTMYNLSRLILFLTGECAEQARMYKRLDFSDLNDILKASENKDE